MAPWTKNELDTIHKAEELTLASVRADGSPRNPVTIWVVRRGQDIFVRSVNGRGSAWFRGAQARHRGHIRAGGVEKDVGLAETDEAVGAALNVGIRPVEVKEIVYQAIPYVGMGKVFDFLNATNDVLTERGIELPLEGQSTTTPDTRVEKGLAIQKEIVGSERVEQMYASAPKDEMHVQRLLSANCFGDHYTRTGINIKTRELLTFAMLISLGGCEPQAKGHVAANLRVGNDRSVLISLATQLLPFIGYPRTLNALRVIDEVAPASAIEGAGR